MALGLRRALLLMLLLLTLLHLLLLLDVLLPQVLELLLLLLLHLLFALVVGFLLIRALPLLRLLLFNALPLLVLLPVEVLQLLLMVLLKLRITVRRRTRWPSRRWTIVAWIAGRLTGLHIRWWTVRTVVTCRPRIRLHVRWRIIRPVIRICRPCGWRTIRAVVVRPVVGRLRIRPVSVRRAIGLHVVRPVGIRGWSGRPIILWSIVRLLPGTIFLPWAILILRRYRPIARVLLRSSGMRRRSNPHCSPGLLLLLNLAFLRGRQGSAAVLLNSSLLPFESWRRRWRSTLCHHRAVYDRSWRPDGARPARADDRLPRGLHCRCGCNDRSAGYFSLVNPYRVVVH